MLLYSLTPTNLQISERLQLENYVRGRDLAETVQRMCPYKISSGGFCWVCVSGLFVTARSSRQIAKARVVISLQQRIDVLLSNSRRKSARGYWNSLPVHSPRRFLISTRARARESARARPSLILPDRWSTTSLIDHDEHASVHIRVRSRQSHSGSMLHRILANIPLIVTFYFISARREFLNCARDFWIACIVIGN